MNSMLKYGDPECIPDINSFYSLNADPKIDQLKKRIESKQMGSSNIITPTAEGQQFMAQNAMADQAANGSGAGALGASASIGTSFN